MKFYIGNFWCTKFYNENTFSVCEQIGSVDLEIHFGEVEVWRSFVQIEEEKDVAIVVPLQADIICKISTITIGSFSFVRGYIVQQVAFCSALKMKMFF